MTVKAKTQSVKKFVADHRVAIAVVVTATAAAALQMRTAKSFNDFLKEKDLFDEYYEMDEV